MSSCKGCQVMKVLQDAGLLGSVQVTKTGEKVTVTVAGCATCGPSKEEAANGKPAAKAAAAPKPNAAKAEAKAEPVKAAKAAPAKPAAAAPAKPPAAPAKKVVESKAAEPATDAAPKAEAKPKVEPKKKGSTTKKVVEEVLVQPEENGHKVFKLSFVFPKPRENADKLFARIKGPVYYALGGAKTIVEMQAQVEEYEQTVWEAAYKGSRVSPALYAVRVMPFVWEDPVTSAGKYDKIKALFSELDRVAEVNMDMKCAFLLPDFGGKQSPKPAGDKKPRQGKGGKGGNKTEPQDPATIQCYQCQQKGHWARDCPNPKKEKKEGDRAPADLSEVDCYQCNQKGHFARDCPNPKKEKKERKGKGKDGDTEKSVPKCYVCQKTGHIAKDCPEGTEETRKENACWHCKETGHRSKDCPQKKDEAPSLATVTCYNCQGKGHFAKDCTNAKQERKKANAPDTSAVLCYNCNTMGHYAKDCTGEPKERKRKERKPRDDEPQELKCAREMMDRETGKTVTRGCGSTAHGFLDCPRHLCTHCDDRHHSSRCPYVK